MNCADKSARKTKIAQGKRRSLGKNYAKLNTNTGQRKESKKSARTGKQQSRKQSKKKCNENSNTNCVKKTATSGEKTQGKRRTPVKNQC